ncbi:MAG: NifU family protein [Putridiphycobacter sp.]|nr:NifU family protein [Putridiphycobacter sp.]
MQVPVTLYAEMTPNPATMKFVANKHIVLSDNNVVFDSVEQAKGYSPLAEALFNFPFVEAVFMSANFITVTKTDNIDWDFIVMELRDFIREWIADGKEVIIRMPAPTAPGMPIPNAAENTANTQSVDRPKFEASALDGAIINLLNEYVRPAVENDGGAIDFIGFNDGKVYVELKGSCAGCPSSTQTLKGGIETLLKSNLEEVQEVVAYS